MTEAELARDLEARVTAIQTQLDRERAERERRADRALTFGAPHRVTFKAPRKRVAKRAPQAAPASVTGALASAQRAVKAGSYVGGLFALAAASVHSGDNASAIRALQAALAA